MPDGTALAEALSTPQRVKGLTHALYRYPARFSPDFVGAVIEEFSSFGDVILDPFVGGGTSVVEAVARGRRAIGFDMNPLAVLVTKAKTTPLTKSDARSLRSWASDPSVLPEPWSDSRLRNAPPALVEALGGFTGTASRLPSERQRDAARLVLLDVGQWAVDRRSQAATRDAIVARVATSTERLIAGLDEFAMSARGLCLRPSDLACRRSVFLGGAAGLAKSRRTNRFVNRVRLVVTSPPYPGVHVLYHRWQVRGRSETAFPYWLADAQDGLGAKHYNMGGRSRIGQIDYFDQAHAIWKSTTRLLRPDAQVVQLVSFADPDLQLPAYLKMMSAAGFELSPGFEASWREVPNRRWYYRVRPDRGRSREVLLVHRPRQGA